jgi:hypothetical protein
LLFNDTVSKLYSINDRKINDYGAVGGMRIESTQRKPAIVPLCPQQIMHDLTWDGTQAAAVGSW